ncbi:glycosyltransferase [Sporomusa paucivorans]|uniref:glycosyltransferase n=1 Tax=Sporomusa paucivorans TaxID=2376 RepID=UPI00357164AD
MYEFKMVIIAHDFPYPPNNGGRVDMWTRIKALHSRGVKIFLITWLNREPSQQEYQEIGKYVEQIIVYRRCHNIANFILSKYPSYIVDRQISDFDMEKLKSELLLFSPQVLLLDGIAGSICALEIMNLFNGKIIFVYRSHNVEYLYAKALYMSEKNLAYKAVRYINIDRVKKIEKFIRDKSHVIFEISQDDYESLNMPNNVFLQNPIIDDKFTESKRYEFDILFIGGLCWPNNIYGLKWFAINCIPYLEKEYKIVFAGSNPSKEFIKFCETYKIEVLPNPKDIKKVLSKGKVLINPIFHGSGVNIKILEMLSTGKSIVSTNKGVRGISKDIRSFIKYTDNAEQFSRYIEEAFKKPIYDLLQVEKFRKIYSPDNIDNMLEMINLYARDENE